MDNNDESVDGNPNNNNNGSRSSSSSSSSFAMGDPPRPRPSPDDVSKGPTFQQAYSMGSFMDVARRVVPEKRSSPDPGDPVAALDEEWFVWAPLPPPLDPDTENKKLANPHARLSEPGPPPQQKSKTICKNFIAGLCPRGALCNFRHDIQRPGIVIPERDFELSPFCLNLMALIVPKKKLVMSLASKKEGSTDKLIGLYVAKQVGIGLEHGDPIIRLMRIDKVVKCFSPYGPLQTPYGITLSNEGDPESEVVARIDEIVDPNPEVIPFLARKYERKIKKLGIGLPKEEEVVKLNQLMKRL